MNDSPAKARLRQIVNQIKSGRANYDYATKTNQQLADLRKTANAWLEEHPDNEEALRRYDRLVEEIDRRKTMGFNL